MALTLLCLYSFQVRITWLTRSVHSCLGGVNDGNDRGNRETRTRVPNEVKYLRGRTTWHWPSPRACEDRRKKCLLPIVRCSSSHAFRNRRGLLYLDKLHLSTPHTLQKFAPHSLATAGRDRKVVVFLFFFGKSFITEDSYSELAQDSIVCSLIRTAYLSFSPDKDKKRNCAVLNQIDQHQNTIFWVVTWRGISYSKSQCKAHDAGYGQARISKIAFGSVTVIRCNMLV